MMSCRKPSFDASPCESPSRLSRALAFCSFIIQYPFFKPFKGQTPEPHPQCTPMQNENTSYKRTVFARSFNSQENIVGSLRSVFIPVTHCKAAVRREMFS